MSQEMQDAAADLLLKHWGHDPVEIRKLAKLHAGLHWNRLLNKAYYWHNTVDVLESCLRWLTAYREVCRDPDLDEDIQRVAERIAVLKVKPPQ